MRVKPLTAAPETILDFPSWAVVVHDEAVGFSAVDARVHGRDIVARLDGVETREQAERLRGGAVGVRRNQLPPLAPGEYYWADLEGMDVFHIAGARLGYVAGFIETGANDVMIVQGERERLIPYLPDVVQRVDTTTRRIDVDWDPDF